MLQVKNEPNPIIGTLTPSQPESAHHKPLSSRQANLPNEPSPTFGHFLPAATFYHLDQVAGDSAPLDRLAHCTPGDIVPVTLETVVTGTGVLQLWCVARDGRRWKLEFSVREQIA